MGIWLTKVEKSCKIVEEKKSLVFVYFFTAIAKVYFQQGMETGCWAMSPPKFETSNIS